MGASKWGHSPCEWKTGYVWHSLHCICETETRCYLVKFFVTNTGDAGPSLCCEC